MIYNKFNTVIRNSKDKYYRFYIDNNKNLIWEEYTSNGLINNTIVKQSVFDYSIDIDKNDMIHILYLTLDGILKYSLFSENQKDKILANFDLKNNNINFLSLKLLSSEIHIFYIVSNKQNIYQLTIFHNMWKDSKWTLEKISDITSLNYPHPFFIDCDSKKNLYLFYSKNSTDIFRIKKYNSEFNLWTDYELDLTIDRCSNTSFFISDKDIAIISYNEVINNNVMTFIKYKDLSKLNSTWSDSIQISNSISNRPSIFSKEGYIYIMWQEGSNIVYKKNADLKHNWSEKKSLITSNDYIQNSVYISNNSEDSNFKSSYIYSIIDTYPMPLINMEDTNSHSTYNEQTTNILTKTFYPNHSMKNNDVPLENSNNAMSNLSEQLTTLSQENYRKSLDIQNLNSEISNLNNLNHEKDSIIENLNSQISELKELNSKYLSEIEEYIRIATLLNLSDSQDSSDPPDPKKPSDNKQNKFCKLFKKNQNK